MALDRKFRVTARRPSRQARMWLFGFPAAILVGVAAPTLAQGDGRDGSLLAPIGHGPRHHRDHGPKHHVDASGRHRDAVPEHRVYRYEGDEGAELDRGRKHHDEGHRPDQPPRDRESLEDDSNEESVADQISARLRSGGLGDHAIAVWHEDGQATLDGRVASEDSKRLAQKLALGVDEVQDVVNRLRVDLGRKGEEKEEGSKKSEAAPSGGKVVGDVTVNVEVNVNVNSGNVAGPADGPMGRRGDAGGPAGPPGHRPDGPPHGSDHGPRDAGPLRGRDRPDQDANVRGLEEQVRRLQAELEAMRRNHEAEGKARQEARESDPRESRWNLDRIRRGFDRQPEEMLQRMEEIRQRTMERRQDRGQDGERTEESGEENDEEGHHEGDGDEDEDRRKGDRDDGGRAKSKSWPFDGIDILPDVAIPKHLMPEVR